MKDICEYEKLYGECRHLRHCVYFGVARKLPRGLHASDSQMDQMRKKENETKLVFSLDGIQYRATLCSGKLMNLHMRESIFRNWQKVPGRFMRTIWFNFNKGKH